MEQTHLSADEQLQQALHLIRYGRSIIVVTGEASDTKTYWLRALEQQCTDAQLYLCALELSKTTNNLEMLSMIALGFGVEYQNTGARALAELLQDFQSSQPRADKSVVLIKNAHLLDSSTLQQIQKMAAFESAVEQFQFVLVYNEEDAVIEPAWRELPHLYDIHINPEIDSVPVQTVIPEPSEVESHNVFQGHLDDALDRVRAKQSAFTHFFALFREAMSQKGLFGFPRAHLMVISIVAVVLLFALLLVQQETTSLDGASVRIELEVPKPHSLVSAQKEKKLARNAEVATSAAIEFVESKAVVTEVFVQNIDAVKPKLAPKPKVAPVPNAIQSEETRSDLLVDLSKQPSKAVAPKSLAPKPVPVTPAPKPVKKVHRPLTERQKYEKQLLALASSRYTLQLFGTHDESKAKGFVRKHANSAKLRYYRGRYQGKAWYMVVAGDYLDSTAAANGAKRLPSVLKRQKPWPRSLSGIQSSIRKYGN